MTISLLSASIGDQQFWQRCFAIKESDIKKSFILGAILFVLIPVSLAFIGFSGVPINESLALPADFDYSLIGFVIVQKLLPAGLATIFLFVLLAGLSSTLDSSLTACSSLYKLIVQKPWREKESNLEELREFTNKDGRKAMIVVGLAGLFLGYIVEIIPGFDLKYLWWSLNTFTAAIVIPTLLSLFNYDVSPKGILRGSGIALLLGLPVFVYGNIVNNDYILAGTYVGIVLISALGCFLTSTQNDNS